MTARSLLSVLMVCGLVLVGLSACSSDDDGGGSDMLNPDGEIRATCEGCHTSDTMLQATVLPDPPDTGESEGEG